MFYWSLLFLQFCMYCPISSNSMPVFSGGIFTFTFQISPIYPHDAPKVKCKTKVIKSLSSSFLINVLLNFFDDISLNRLIFGGSHKRNKLLQIYHPNIDLEGNVCLNILREDWKPVLNINTVIYGLYHLFTVRLQLLVWIVVDLCLQYHSLCVFVCRNRIMRTPSTLMQLQCWGITLSCSSLMWEGQCLVGMWARPSSLDVYRGRWQHHEGNQVLML